MTSRQFHLTDGEFWVIVTVAVRDASLILQLGLQAILGFDPDLDQPWHSHQSWGHDGESNHHMPSAWLRPVQTCLPCETLCACSVHRVGSNPHGKPPP